MKGKWKKKLEYFWMYYKIPFFVVLAVSVVFVYFLYAKLTEKEYGFNAILFDIHTDTAQQVIEKEYASYAGINVDKYEVLISTSLLLADGTSNYAMTSRSKFYSLIGTEDLDVAMMLEENFVSFSRADAFYDLREIFTEAELSAFPKLYTDHQGRVIGIYGGGFLKIKEIDGYSDADSECVVGIIYNTRHLEEAKKFIQYLQAGGKNI